jgi:uracil-DNA glycosylase
MDVDIHKSWKPYLQAEFDKPYFKNLVEFVKTEYSQHECFPPGNLIFNAFEHCHFDDLKVVILGQDPYHGHPPSLINIFKEIESDLGVSYPSSGNLERWADQGVLLLNATLTVRAHNAGSHQKQGWELFTDAVIKNVIFLLWGGYAKNKIKLINKNKHHILTSGHPSPLSANRGYWFDNKHFSKSNYLLEQAALNPIVW